MYRASQIRQSFLTFGFLITIAITVALVLIPVNQREKLKEDLTRAARMYRIGYASHIALENFTDFAWDEVHIFLPGTSDVTIKQRLGFYWQGTQLDLVTEPEGFALLVFVKERRVIRWVWMPGNDADFTHLADQSPFTPQTAIFFLPFDDDPALQVIR